MKTLAGLAIFAATWTANGSPLFEVKSTGESVKLPITLCLDGIKKSGCQNYNATGTMLDIKTLTKSPTSYKNAGITLHGAKYVVWGCVPHESGYCIFAVNNFGYTKLELKS